MKGSTFVAVLAAYAAAEDNGLGITPPMGWNPVIPSVPPHEVFGLDGQRGLVATGVASVW